MRIFTDSSWRQASPSQAAGAKIPSGEIVFSGKSARTDGGDAFRGGAKLKTLAGQLYGAQVNPDLAFEVDASKDPNQTTLNGALALIQDVLASAEQSIKGRTSDHAYVLVTYPKESDVALLQATAAKLQRVIKPGTFDFVGKSARGMARAMTGVHGDVSSLEVKPVPGNARQALIRAGLKNVDQADVAKLRGFLDHCAPFLNMLGIGG